MNTIYCSFSDLNYRNHQDLLIEHIKKNNIFDTTIKYTKEVLFQNKFYFENQKILDKERLCGYCLWKPYLILETLKYIDSNDILVYMDCGDIPTNKNINYILKNHFKNNDLYLTNKSWNINKKLTKRDCFVLMNCDEEKYWNDFQIEAGFLAFKKTDFTIQLISEWLEFCKNENILTDIDNICGLNNFNEFIDHRHDQSVISLLKTKYKINHNYEVLDYIKFNALCHKNGSDYFNGSGKWSKEGVLK